ncbi:MAG: hypothetical protein HOP91_05520 [Sphingomonas sp.]|nr:hypothetical protein [Sphingomonas sp.]
MRRETIRFASNGRIDWKGLGYLISIVSVFFLGAVAWPKFGEPQWHAVALVLGMATSIIGMGCRYKAHLDEQRELKKTEAEVRAR